MKKIFILMAMSLFAFSAFAQDFSDDDLFGGSDDDLFGGFDDAIEELEDTTAKSDLSKGVLYETGSIKIGGNFTTSIGTSTVIYADDDKDFVDHLSESTLTPTVSAYLTVDARPSQDLRMYTKFGLAYPFVTKATSTAVTTSEETKFTNPLTGEEISLGEMYNTTVSTSISEWFKLKEIFTDFSIADTAFFRFGLHTVTWGTGYFFSPVSDMINTSSINPEDVSAQVDGSLNLRTQITLPNTQDCLWFYIIPSTDFINSNSVTSYTKKTAFAGKYEFVVGGWEFGAGGYWRWEDSPKAMLTTSGSLKNLNVFGEAVYLFGGASEWKDDQSVNGKTSIFQGTIGASYYWKTPAITLAGQYYYDGNTVDKMINMQQQIAGNIYTITLPRITQGHNVGVMVNFGKIFGDTDLTASILALANFDREEISSTTINALNIMNMGSYVSYFNCGTFSATLSYKPINAITISAGPYMTFTKFEEPPVVSMKFDFKLGGGKF